MDDEFDDAWAVAATVPGWLTHGQARALWDAARQLPVGSAIVEIGSHQGRSTVVLGRAAAAAGARVIAIDPFIGGAMFGGSATRAKFERNVADAGVDGVVQLVTQRSTVLRPAWDTPLAMVYVDGKHDYWTARDDLRWVAHVPPGAPVLVHDSFSSIGVTAAILAHVLPGRELRYLGRVGSLARFEAAAPGRRDRARILAELPWFVRNVLIKVVLRAGRVVGYRRSDPY
ncbi:Methyltransferase domain-containing protein [Jatrophihabitans endophyticus]|uniref:Methyltransferase domain-containing protein n=1 Tax=Jatrophihabitans endophyticus TaxID=1206085 RepID=A0A1M5CY67_9ACTN|nr:class I SAM-dependent methyltransferase [Jatrophihabitans endophyticus]SHF59639.1 Methyltransferase domain-containing protein [Jatrophihabitans endophyticus]